MGAGTPEDQAFELHRAVEDLVVKALPGIDRWPEEMRTLLAEQLEVLLSGLSEINHEIFERAEYSPYTFRPAEGYVAFPIPTPLGDRFCRVEPNADLNRRVRSTPRIPDSRSETEIVAYLDSNDAEAIDLVLRALENLRLTMGYVEAELIEERRGSIWRVWRARLKGGLTSEHVTERLAKLERAISIGFLDEPQAKVDLQEAQAFATLLAALSDIPRACIRHGSILLIKYTDPLGTPQVLSRNLSQVELAALERYPAIQSHPETALDQLRMAVYELTAGQDQDSDGAPGEVEA